MNLFSKSEGKSEKTEGKRPEESLTYLKMELGFARRRNKELEADVLFLEAENNVLRKRLKALTEQGDDGDNGGDNSGGAPDEVYSRVTHPHLFR